MNLSVDSEEKFDYLKSLQDSRPTVVIEHFIKEFYKPSDDPYDIDFRSTDYQNIPILCVLIRKPILSKLIIYYQNKQWQYLRYDYIDNIWTPIECMFFDLRDCIDIFESKKERMRFIRSVWSCNLDWLISERPCQS